MSRADRQDGNRNRRCDREAGAQADIDRNRAKQYAEDAAQQDRPHRQLRPRVTGLHIRLKTGGAGRARGLRRGLCVGRQDVSSCGANRNRLSLLHAAQLAEGGDVDNVHSCLNG